MQLGCPWLTIRNRRKRSNIEDTELKQIWMGFAPLVVKNGDVVSDTAADPGFAKGGVWVESRGRGKLPETESILSIFIQKRGLKLRL